MPASKSTSWVPAQGVVYSTSELIPGATVFRCERMTATLQVSSCARMWADARDGKGMNDRCRGCSVGAAHNGSPDPSTSPICGRPVCARCGGQGQRLIGRNVCVSCKNREYEWLKGRNAKGKPPACHPTLERRRVVYRCGSSVRVLQRELTASTGELVIELLRDSPTRVAIGFGVGRVRVYE